MLRYVVSDLRNQSYDSETWICFVTPSSLRWMDLLKHQLYDKKEAFFKASVSSSTPCMCRLVVGLCLSPFSWPMKMATTKANQETTRAKYAG